VVFLLNTFFDKFIFTNGLKYKHNNFFLINIPFCIVPSELLVSISALGKKQLDQDIYYAVKDSTRRSLLKQFDLDFGLEGKKNLGLISEFFSASGWGKISIVDLDEKGARAIIVVNSSPVASALHGKAKAPVDHFLRGIFAGLMWGFFNENVDCVETACTAINDQQCKFIIKKQAEFDFSHNFTRMQLNPEH